MRLNKHLVVAMLIGLLALPAVSISHPIFHPITVKADVYTIVHDAFLKHGARKIGTADDMGVKSPIYEVIRNGQKVDWDSGDVTVKINGHNPKRDPGGDSLTPMLKLVDSSNQYDNSLSKKSLKPKVSSLSKNKMKHINKNKTSKNHKSKANFNNSSNNSKSNNSNKPVKNKTKKSSHKNIGLIAGVVVIIIAILGIIGGFKHHNKESHY